MKTYTYIYGTESLERNPCIYSQLIYYKGAKNIQLEKDCLYEWCRENRTVNMQKSETELLP